MARAIRIQTDADSEARIAGPEQGLRLTICGRPFQAPENLRSLLRGRILSSVRPSMRQPTGRGAKAASKTSCPERCTRAIRAITYALRKLAQLTGKVRAVNFAAMAGLLHAANDNHTLRSISYLAPWSRSRSSHSRWDG
jgi:hypothetical protein